MTQDLLSLLDALTLEKVDQGHYIGHFVGHYLPATPTHVFGGQTVAQTISAALREVEPDKSLHSMHSYFLDRGTPQKTFHFHVDHVRDGRSFCTRQVSVRQDERQIYNATLSFHKVEEGLQYQKEMPKVGAPEEYAEEADRWNNHPTIQKRPTRQITFHPLNVRHTGPIDWFASEPTSPMTGVWIKTREKIGDDRQIHQSLLGYFSDAYLYGASLRPHGLTFCTPNVQGASLDHSIWFHDDFRADEWLFYQQQGTWSGRARGLNHGKFFTRDGRHVASTAQEGLFRLKEA